MIFVALFSVFAKESSFCTSFIGKFNKEEKKNAQSKRT